MGALLRVLAASKPNGRFLQLGTRTGVATAWLLDGIDTGSTLTSLDTDPQAQAVARQVLADSRLTLVIEGAVSFLRGQPAGMFDLVFADAFPGKYEARHEALRMVRTGGFYVVDDLSPQRNWPDGTPPKSPC